MFAKFSSEDAARHRAREIEGRLASVLLPGRANAPTTIGGLIDGYLVSLWSRSTRYAERQEYLLRMWVRPVLGDHALSAWTPSDSEAVLDRALAPSTVQNVGSAMRTLVTFAYKNRWIPGEADPMWLVRYSPTAEVQGQAIGFIPRSSLPTDEECNRLFKALDATEQAMWALAMRLKHRSGLRWGEPIALRPFDLDFDPLRVIRVHRAVEQSRQGLAIKSTIRDRRDGGSQGPLARRHDHDASGRTVVGSWWVDAPMVGRLTEVAVRLGEPACAGAWHTKQVPSGGSSLESRPCTS